MSEPHEAPRVARGGDVTRVVDLLVGAFYDDPTWSWAFPDPARRAEQHRRWWRLFVEGALRYDWVWLGAGDAATSVWIPPGGTELSTEQEADLEPLLSDLLGDDSARVLDALNRFDATHPRDQPHYYLSLLATDPAQRGHGHGLTLLAANLSTIDQEGMPAYLEASNPANVALYQRFGFHTIGGFALPGSTITVHTMWRDASHPHHDRR